MVVSPSASGGTTHPYLLSLTDATAGDLDAYVPVAPVGVSTLADGNLAPQVLANLQVRFFTTVSCRGHYELAHTARTACPSCVWADCAPLCNPIYISSSSWLYFPSLDHHVSF